LSDRTYFTVSNGRFFSGTVALLNSLRITGNDGDLVVLDQGLTPDQRRRLEPHARVEEIRGHAWLLKPWLLKPYPFLMNPEGVVVLVDSDMIVTNSLDEVIAQAAAGRICLFPDHYLDRDRWFPEWQELFELQRPLRRGTYLNSGFVALSIRHWPNLLERWWKACGRIPEDRIFSTEDSPFRDPDQDALNALLMSEVEEGAVYELPEWGQAYHGRVHVDDMRTLRCTDRGREILILHHSRRPKVLHTDGRSRIDPLDAYLRLLPRVLLGDDVTLRLERRELPLWVRGGLAASVVVATFWSYNRLTRFARRLAAYLTRSWAAPWAARAGS
jgi:hypothetical protein